MNPRYKYDIQALHLNLSDAEWIDVDVFQREYASRRRASAQDNDWQRLKKWYSAYLQLGHKIYLIRQDGQAFGTAIFYEKSKLGSDFVFFQYDFIAPYLDQNILDEILVCFLKEWPSAKHLVLKSMDAKNDYIEQVLFSEISEFRELFELKLNELDKALLVDWTTSSLETKGKNKISVLTEKDLAVDLRDDYYAMISELNADITHKSKLFDRTAVSPEQIQARDKAFSEQGVDCLALFLVKDEELLGYTEVTISPNQPKLANQNMTGVKKAYRGKGLGKILKVSMLQRLLREYPNLSKIKTAIHVENSPSQGLNRSLGFKKVGAYKEYILTKESILNYVAARQLPPT